MAAAINCSDFGAQEHEVFQCFHYFPIYLPWSDGTGFTADGDSGKDPDTRKDWRQEEKGMTEDEMVEWHHWLKGHQFEQDTGVGDGQGSLVYCSPWGGRELDMTERLNNNLKLLENNGYISLCYALYPCCWSVLLTLNIKINIRKKE